MTIFQICLTYVLSWWLVLFMVLPTQAEPPAQPGLGHAPSAPENPRLGKKFIWTSGLAIVPTLCLYLLFSSIALAAGDEIYHVGPGCTPHGVYHAPADLNASDGTAAGGKKVMPATIGGGSGFGGNDRIHVGLQVPSTSSGTEVGGNTTATSAPPYLNLGDVAIGADGTATLNGKSITGDPGSDGCP